MKSVGIVGSRGLVGSTAFNYLSSIKGLKVDRIDRKYASLRSRKYDFIINCSGEKDGRKWLNCLYCNWLIPHFLSFLYPNSKIIHISTDGVFSDYVGNHKETDSVSLKGFYSWTKWMGESKASNIFNIRTSFADATVIQDGQEVYASKKSSWNGVSKIVFAKICENIIRQDLILPNIYHLHCDGYISRYELLSKFSKKNFRLIEGNEPFYKRHLSSVYGDLGKLIWKGVVKEIGFDMDTVIAKVIEKTK